MDIQTVNNLKDIPNYRSYTRLSNCEMLADLNTHILLMFNYGKKLKVCKSNLLRVLVPESNYIKKWIL